MMNPYEPPDKESVVTVEGSPKRKTNLRSLLIPTLVGAVAGSWVLAPLTLGPGDPTGHGIAFGLGGIVSLIASMTIRAIKRQLQP